MVYDVRFIAGGEEQTDRIEAPDAASAAATVQQAHDGAETGFELLAVQLIDDAPFKLDDSAGYADN